LKAQTILLESSLMPDATTISATRKIVDEISSQVLDDADLGWRLAMAAHELLDNARKYGCEGFVRFLLLIDGEGVTVRVENNGGGEYGATLVRTIDEIRNAPDPWALYLEVLERAAAREEGSGLGLARISAEGGMQLYTSIDDDANVRVEARLERRAS
jgi:hypothetical protein